MVVIHQSHLFRKWWSPALILKMVLVTVIVVGSLVLLSHWLNQPHVKIRLRELMSKPNDYEESEELNEESEKLNEESKKLNEESKKLNEESKKLNETRYRRPATPRDKIESNTDHCQMGQEVPTWQQFFSLVGDTISCAKMEKFGGEGGNPARDGAKAVCMDAIFAPRAGNCNVISVGICNEWSFDDALANRDCKVFSFDPTMGAADHQRGKNIRFYKLGLSGSKGTIGTNQSVESYRGILKHIGLLNTTIDYLKIDIEGSEYEFFEDVLFKDTELLSRVKQMGVEIHIGNNLVRRARMWKILHRLRCLKFRSVFSEPNLVAHNPYLLDDIVRVSDCYEMVWINERFLG